MRLALVACFACLAACSTAGVAQHDDDASAPTFSTDPLDASIGARATRVLNGCAGGPESACHGASAGGMHLPDDPPNLVNVASTERPEMARVKPFEPDQSYLWLKVVGDGGIDGAPMPGGGPIDPDARAVLLAWIEAGAP